MNTELSSDAKSLLSSLKEDSLIDPDNWHFNISAGGKSIHCNPQLTRHLVREPLVEINQYKPNFLSPLLKKEFNLIRATNGNDLAPTEAELTRLKDKLQALTEDQYLKFDLEHLMQDPDYKIENTIVSAWMIDINDVIDYLNGEAIENIYYRVVERRKRIDKPFEE